MAVIFNDADEPIEVSPGGGDLRYSSSPLGLVGGGMARSLSTVDGKVISHGNVFASQPWVAAAVMTILAGAYRVPLKVYRREDNDSRTRLRAKDHPLAAAIDKPWLYGTPGSLTMAMLGSLMVHGNGPAGVDSGASGSIRFTETDWRTLEPIEDDNKRLRGWYRNFGKGDREIVSRREMLNVSWWSPLSDVGISPLNQLQTTVAIEEAAQRFGRQTFANGARPPSAITVNRDELPTDKVKRQEVFDNLRADITNLYASPDNAGRPALLPPGLDWKPIGHSAVEAELIDIRKINREEIAAVYRIPPPMIGILDHATFSNIETQREMFYGECLGAPLVLIENELNSRVVRDLLREDDIYVEYDFGAVLRGNRLQEVNALRLAVNNALMTPNEARQKLNLPTSDAPEADQLWLQSKNNMAPLGQLSSGENDGGSTDA